MSRPTTILRGLLARGRLIVAPGVADALNARLVAREGFEAIYMTGAGTAVTRLGWPDVGMLTMMEMADNAARIADAAAGIPLIADADTGYGGVMNVRRTVQAYERAGVAGLHIEDQAWPKRCGHLAGKAVVPTSEMVARIRAACDARNDPDTVIIARTDALALEGFSAALDRGHAYAEAGADVIFIEAPTDREQLAAIPRTFAKPTLYNLSASGKTPSLPAAELEQLGFRIAIYPNFMVLAAIPAAQAVLRTLKQTGSVDSLRDGMASFRDFFDIARMPEVQELESRYAIPGENRAGY
jgi:2-methylisocitrate lyase-like PEP mutase family enzyme